MAVGATGAAVMERIRAGAMIIPIARTGETGMFLASCLMPRQLDRMEDRMNPFPEQAHKNQKKNAASKKCQKNTIVFSK